MAKQKLPTPPKGANTAPVRKSGGQKPKGNPKWKSGRPNAGKLIVG